MVIQSIARCSFSRKFCCSVFSMFSCSIFSVFTIFSVFDGWLIVELCFALLGLLLFFELGPSYIIVLQKLLLWKACGLPIGNLQLKKAKLKLKIIILFFIFVFFINKDSLQEMQKFCHIFLIIGIFCFETSFFCLLFC